MSARVHRTVQAILTNNVSVALWNLVHINHVALMLSVISVRMEKHSASVQETILTAIQI